MIAKKIPAASNRSGLALTADDSQDAVTASRDSQETSEMTYYPVGYDDSTAREFCQKNTGGQVKPPI